MLDDVGTHFLSFSIQNMIVTDQESDWSWPTWLRRLLALPPIFKIMLSSGWTRVGKYKNKFSACYLARIAYIPLKTALVLQTFWLFPPFLKILGGLWGSLKVGLDLDLMGTHHMGHPSWLRLGTKYKLVWGWNSYNWLYSKWISAATGVLTSENAQKKGNFSTYLRSNLWPPPPFWCSTTLSRLEF